MWPWLSVKKKVRRVPTRLIYTRYTSDFRGGPLPERAVQLRTPIVRPEKKRPDVPQKPAQVGPRRSTTRRKATPYNSKDPAASMSVVTKNPFALLDGTQNLILLLGV